MTHVRTHTHVTFANPFLRCAECGQQAEAFHDPGRCGCESEWSLVPCRHLAEVVSVCPSWGPVDGCRCDDPATDHRADRLAVESDPT